MFAAIHWYLVGQSYPHQFEQFSWQYSVLDNIAKLQEEGMISTYNSRGNKVKKFKNIPHTLRPELVASMFDVKVPAMFRKLNGLTMLRNNLIHEARWFEEPLGYAVTQDGHEIIMALTYFNSQAILGTLGIECAFRQQQSQSVSAAAIA